jgi:hypothetical protein
MVVEAVEHLSAREYAWSGDATCADEAHYRKCTRTFEAYDYRDDRMVRDPTTSVPWTLTATIWLPLGGEGPFPVIMADFEHGVWVFSNIDRAFICSDGAEGFIGFAAYQRVEAADAAVLRISAPDAPTYVHPIVGEPGEFFNPCDNSAPEPAYIGAVDIRANDNDGPNEGSRANSFGDRARGVVHDGDGKAYRVGWTTRIVLPPDMNGEPGVDFDFDPAWMKVYKVVLHPIGR